MKYLTPIPMTLILTGVDMTRSRVTREVIDDMVSLR
jgi:hypothetical protein